MRSRWRKSTNSDATTGPRPCGAARMPDDRLGMQARISRRDYLTGTLLASAGLVLGRDVQTRATISPADDWDGYGGVGDYARAHGNMYEMMTTAHRLRDGAFASAIAGATDTGEMYDLIAVGGGISGLAAAVLFQKQRRGRPRPLLRQHAGFCGAGQRQ